MSEFNRACVKGMQNEASRLIADIETTYGFVIDRGGRIQTEWLSTCSGPVFGEWFLKLMHDGKICYVDASINQCDKKHITIRCGLPKSSKDIVYIATANVTTIRYIVAEDPDFFDPKIKALANAIAKERAKQARNGCVCRYLRCQMRIRVGTVTHAVSELCSPAPPHQP
ncbi:MAG: hypothetical protein ABSA41_07225 [Terriglobia bacterium]|jgi:hypothetical protein